MTDTATDSAATSRATRPFASDSDLLAWRDAAVAGELPAPWRTDRWQALRAGVTNLWEFEVAEYWYADGWVQLTGRNETGKSSLMALTTLIPWLGDTSTANIDTLGDQGKRFRYYVEPTEHDGDRRDAATSTNRGWLWVEYARLTPAGPQYFTTMLYADARRASATLTLRWCTLQGESRIRRGVELSAAGMVVPAADLRETPGFVAHGSARDYRAHVAGHLLGASVEQLETVGKMLRVARTPKLGERLNATFVSRKMRDALPALEQSEVDALAAGWDQLDRIRADLEATSAAAAAVRAYVTGAWLPWVRARLRRAADDAAAARTAFDRVARQAREAGDVVEGTTQELAGLDTQIQSAVQHGDAAERSYTELVATTRYADAAGRVTQVTQARREAAAAADDAKARVREAATAKDRQVKSRLLADQAASVVPPRARRREQATTRLTQSLPPAGLDRFTQACVEADWPRLLTAVRERRDRLAQLRALFRAFEQRDAAATVSEQEAGSRRSAATEATADADSAWSQAERIRDEIAAALAVWSHPLEPPVARAAVDRWVDALPSSAQQKSTLDAVLRADWLAPHTAAAQESRIRAAHEVAAAEARLTDIGTRITELEQAPGPLVPDPAGWQRRQRPREGVQTGAPVWSLLHPLDELEPAQVARIEAALAAMGILDAWVTPDAVYDADRDGADVVIDLRSSRREDLRTKDRPTGPTLATVLRVDPAGPLAGPAGELLSRIAYAEPLTDGQPQTDGQHADGQHADGQRLDYALSADGSWHSPIASGRAEPVHEHAELLGEAARRASRTRRLDELRTLQSAARADRQRWSDQAEAAAAEIARLVAAFDSRPTDGPLVSQLALSHDRTQRAERLQAQAGSAERRAAELRGRADVARSEALEHATAHGLPMDVDDRALLQEALGAVELLVEQTRAAVRAHEDASVAAETARARAEDDDQIARHKESAAAAAGQSAAELAESAQRLARMVDSDTQEVLREATELQRVARTAKERRAELAGQREHVVIRKAKAETTLEQAEAERVAATTARDRTFASFRLLVDAGLLDQAGVDVPDVESVAVEKVRDQVAVARSSISLRDWPADPDSQQAVVDSALSRLAKRTDELRATLESAGRTVRLNDEGRTPQVEVVVDSSGSAYDPRAAAARLGQTHQELAAAYDEKIQATLHELLGSTFIEHLRDRLVEVYALVERINAVLGAHPTGTTRTALRIRLTPVGGASAEVLRALQDGRALLDDHVADQVRGFLRARIDGARDAAAAAGEVQWRDRLAQALDYREWFEVTLEKKSGQAGRWTPLTPSTYAGLSGGARVVMLMLPLVATLAALYGSMAAAPRPLWLDEAFDGLDADNRATVLDLFAEFDLDVLVAGPGRLLNARTVRAAAIYQVVRAQDPYPGADLAVELWAGGELSALECPDLGARVAPAPKGPSLFDAAEL